MRLLLDEMLSPVVAAQLRDRAHDVEAISGSPHQGGPDPEVLELARRERRVLVTNNIDDFRRLHHEAAMPGGPGQFGLLFIPGGRPWAQSATGRLVRDLEGKRQELPTEADLADGETLL